MAVTWQAVSTPNTGTATITDILGLGSGRFVAIGTAGTVLTSADDGLTWTARTAAASGSWTGLAFDGTTVVAVAATGATRVMTSTDFGHTWTGHAAAAANDWSSVTYAAFLGMFIAVSQSGASQVMTSTNSGASWTSRSASSVKAWSNVAASGSLVMAMEGTTGAVMLSTDGINWSDGAAAPTSFLMPAPGGSSGFVWSTVLSRFVAGGTSGATVAKLALTTDGSAWTYQTAAPLSSYGWAVGLVDANSYGGFFAAPLIDSGLSPVPTIILESADGGTTWIADDTTISGTWLPTGWNNDSGTVVFWDNDKTNRMLVGSAAVGSLTASSPATGSTTGNTLVTITGTGLAAVAQGDVLFDGAAALSVTPAASGLSLTCLSPAHGAGTVDIVVTGIGTLSAAFTYVAVTKVTPNKGPTVGGQAVTITGSGFNAATGATFGGVAATAFVVVSNTQIACVTPAHAKGTVDVVVAGVGTLTGAYGYLVGVTPPPFSTTALKLPPVPVASPGVQPTTESTALLMVDYQKWLMTAKQAIEQLPQMQLDASQIVGTFTVAQIPTLPWSKISKVGSSLADLETRSASDLSSGTLPAGRMPALTGDVTSVVGTVATTLATVNANVGTFGTATQSARVTVNAKGLTTAVSEVLITPAATDITSPAALTKTDDTNVTATLTGSPSTSLLRAVNVALGWTGTLAPVRGGAGTDLSGVAKGGLIVGTAAGTFGLKAVGADATILTADAASAGGVKWAAAPATGPTAAQVAGYVSLRVL